MRATSSARGKDRRGTEYIIIVEIQRDKAHRQGIRFRKYLGKARTLHATSLLSALTGFDIVSLTLSHRNWRCNRRVKEANPNGTC